MKKHTKIAVLFLLFPLAMASVSAKGVDDEETGQDAVILTGRIKITGSEPHTTIVLQTEEGINYTLLGALTDNLRKNFQLKQVQITGTLLSPPVPLRAAGVEVASFGLVE